MSFAHRFARVVSSEGSQKSYGAGAPACAREEREHSRGRLCHAVDRGTRRLAAGVVLAMALALAFLFPGRAAADPCPPGDCTPTGTPPPNPSMPVVVPACDPISDVLDKRYANALFGSFGGEYSIKLLDEWTTPAATLFGLPPAYDSKSPLGGTTPFHNIYNTFSPLDVGARFHDNLWLDGQMDQFAGSVQIMMGASSTGIWGVESGVGRTRIAGNSSDERKYVLGALNHGTITEGGTVYDTIGIFGSLNMGTVALDSYNEFEPTVGPPSEYYRRANVSLVQGSESDAWIGRTIGRSTVEGGVYKESPWNGFQQQLHEDDYWNPVPAVVSALFGSTHYTIIDGKKGGFNAPAAEFSTTCPWEAGFISDAWAVRAGVVGFVEGSWINVNSARALYAIMAIGDAFEASPGYFNGGNERPGSVVRDWVGIEIPPPFVPADVCVNGTVGAAIFDQNPEASGGMPLLNPAVLPGERQFAIKRNPEMNASLVTRGDVVIGDGLEGGTGFGTDVLHINDAVRLRPRTSPPVPERSVADADTVGLMYYDLSRNSLRMSVPLVVTDARTRKKSTAVVWRDVQLYDDPAGFDERDVLRGDVETLKRMSRGERRRGDMRARSKSTQEEMSLVAPRVEVMVDGATKRVAAEEEVTMMFSGVPRADLPKVEIFYRRLGSVGRGTAPGAIPWTKVEPQQMRGGKDVPEVSLQLDFARKAADGHEGHGQVVQIMALTPSGDTIGTSFRLKDRPRTKKPGLELDEVAAASDSLESAPLQRPK